MITVYIWSPSDGMGHASMLVQGGTPPGDIHISYWPSAQGRELNWIQPPGYSGQNYNAPPNPNQTFADDMRMERDRDSDPPRLPAWSIQINGLNETAIKTWWAGIRRTHPRWDTTSFNCSTVVYLALQAGGASSLCIRSRICTPPLLAWTPMDVLAYAREVQMWSRATPEQSQQGRADDRVIRRLGRPL